MIQQGQDCQQGQAGIKVAICIRLIENSQNLPKIYKVHT
jgi:hypothetical protein